MTNGIESGLAVTIEPAGPHDFSVDLLWESAALRPGTPDKPGTCLVARDRRSGQIVGAAEYVRTFPPEDGMWAVTVAPHARRQGVGTRLLRALADAALRDGIRSLAAFVDVNAEATWRLLGAVGIPVRIYWLRKSALVELDLVYLLRRHTQEMEQEVLPADGDGSIREEVAAPTAQQPFLFGSWKRQENGDSSLR